MNLRGYLKLAQAPFQMILAYRTATFLRCLGVVLRVYLMRVFWTAVYGLSLIHISEPTRPY